MGDFKEFLYNHENNSKNEKKVYSGVKVQLSFLGMPEIL
jgi:hypothetical protein